MEKPESDRTRLNRRLVFSYLDVSTGNLPKEEFERVKRGEGVGDPHEYGAWVWVPEHEDSDSVANDAERFPHLAAIVALARDLGCRWINFDQDADFLEGFPAFDW